MSLEQTIGKCLNDAQISLTTHKKGAKTLCARRRENPEAFLPTFCNAVLPVLLEYRVRARGDGEASNASRMIGVSTRETRARVERRGGGTKLGWMDAFVWTFFLFSFARTND